MFQLVDRAARYLQLRHQQSTGEALSYVNAVRAVFTDLARPPNR